MVLVGPKDRGGVISSEEKYAEEKKDREVRQVSENRNWNEREADKVGAVFERRKYDYHPAVMSWCIGR